MNTTRIWFFRALILVTLVGSCICLAHGKDAVSDVRILRNVVWNDFVVQLKSPPSESAEDSLAKELSVIQNFLASHQRELRVGIYDAEVFKTIDHARARLRKADKDLETLRNELSYREELARLGK